MYKNHIHRHVFFPGYKVGVFLGIGRVRFFGFQVDEGYKYRWIRLPHGLVGWQSLDRIDCQEQMVRSLQVKPPIKFAYCGMKFYCALRTQLSSWWKITKKSLCKQKAKNEVSGWYTRRWWRRIRRRFSFLSSDFIHTYKLLCFVNSLIFSGMHVESMDWPRR